jgi:hypothetical protein
VARAAVLQDQHAWQSGRRFRSDENSTAVPRAELRQVLQDDDLVMQVQVVDGLVEQQDARILGEQRGSNTRCRSPPERVVMSRSRAAPAQRRGAPRGVPVNIAFPMPAREMGCRPIGTMSRTLAPVSWMNCGGSAPRRKTAGRASAACRQPDRARGAVQADQRVEQRDTGAVGAEHTRFAGTHA